MADVETQPPPQQPETKSGDPRSKQEEEEDAKLAERLSIMIEEANQRIVPLCKMIRQVSLHTMPIVDAQNEMNVSRK